MTLIRFARQHAGCTVVDGASHSQWASAYRTAGRAKFLINPGRTGGGYCATLLKFGLPFHSDWVLECTSSQKQAAEAITALLRHNPTISAVVCYNETIAMGAWFGLLKAGRQSGESGVDRYFEQQVSLAAFTDATPTTLDDIPVIWASTPARELGTTLADRMMQKITHEETHSRNLIIPARLIAAK